MKKLSQTLCFLKISLNLLILTNHNLFQKNFQSISTNASEIQTKVGRAKAKAAVAAVRLRDSKIGVRTIDSCRSAADAYFRAHAPSI